MRKNLVARLATAAVGGAVALAVAAPAFAHDDPEPGYNTVLHAPHHDKVATDESWPDCDTVREDLGDDADDLISEGFDVWVFYIPEGTFDTTEIAAKIRFNDAEDGVQTAVVPGGSFDYWTGPGDEPDLAALAVPAGWTLSDGDFNVVGSEHRVEVKRTCPDRMGEGSDPESTGQSAPQTEDQGNRDLPMTGAQVGGMLILGGGLLAAGIAMTAVKRRRDLSDLLGD